MNFFPDSFIRENILTIFLEATGHEYSQSFFHITLLKCRSTFLKFFFGKVEKHQQRNKKEPLTSFHGRFFLIFFWNFVHKSKGFNHIA